MIKSKKVLNLLLVVSYTGFFIFAAATSYMRTEATIIGYQLGKLKSKEAELLELRSSLKTNVAHLTTKENLEYVIDHEASKTKEKL